MQFKVTALCALASIATFASAESHGVKAFKKAERAAQAHHARNEARMLQQPAAPAAEKRQSSPYLNDQTRQFVVDGTAIPDVDFDVGESYAGLLPISASPDETRKLFFWFFPSSNPDASNEIAIWFNGGPGCSSLSGLLSENGPFQWQAGTLAPVQNPYSWTNLTNMLWVEQPVGVGFSQGVPNITNEVELGQQFAGFYRQFVDAFQVQNRKVYITGESYGGYYVPYVADAFINAQDPVYYNLAGVAINDPILGDGTLQQEVPIVPFVDYWSKLFFLNDSFTQQIHDTADRCNYTDYFNTYLQFPPPSGKFPTLPEDAKGCDVFDSVFAAAVEVNPCFSVYHVLDYCPFKYSVLGIVNPGDYEPPGGVVYFNRTDVQMAINAPVGTNWSQCTSKNVFDMGSMNQSVMDGSLGPAQNDVLKHVIESTNNTIIGVGGLDFLLPTNGSLLAIQNITWNGVQGFTERPSEQFYVPYHPEYNQGALSGAGNAGYWITQRGLTFYEVQLAGHELPEYQAGAGYRVLETLLGRVPNLGTTGDFSTQSGDFTGNGEMATGPAQGPL